MTADREKPSGHVTASSGGTAPDYQFDIAISYASEDETIASMINRKLERRGVETFFAPSRPASRLGEHMESVFTRSYAEKTRFVVVLVSDHYPRKEWAMFELGVALDEEERRGETVVIPLLLSGRRPDTLLPNKISLDLRKMEIETAVAELAERVKMDRGEIAPREAFEKAFLEWKRERFVPGFKKGTFFVEHVDELEIDVDRCEFLLHCPTNNGNKRRDAFGKIDPKVLAAAGERYLKKADYPGHRLNAIACIGFVDPRSAEQHLRRIYEDPDQAINDRARAFAELWKCENPEVTDESARLLLRGSASWEFRRAAAKNILWGPLRDDTERVLGQAIHDPRREVRSVVTDAIIKFGLKALAPELMKAYRKQRSRKGRNDIEHALRHFNDRSDVVEFGKEMGLGPAFFRPLSYIHDWEKNREGWL